MPGSPAFGKGVATWAAVDERGFARPAQPSVGAYQPQYSATATPGQVFVENVYEVLLNRVADPGGLAAGTGFLNAGGAPLALVQILQSGPEFLDAQVSLLYRRYLDRAPAPAETTTVANFLKSGVTPEQLAAALIGSAEFTADYGGGTSDTFVEAAFVAALGRPTSGQPELVAWDAALAAGTSHATVGTLLLTSTEYLADLVVSDFESYVGRGPSTADMAAFLAAAKAGFSSTVLEAIALGASFASRT